MIPVKRPDPAFVGNAILAKSAKEYEEWTYDVYPIRDTEKKGRFGQGVKIAVLDTGVPRHKDFKSLGYDMRSQPYRFVMDGDNRYDYDGHATHVGGILFAEHNGFGVKGVVPSASNVFLKVLDDDGSGIDDDVAQAIIYASKVLLCDIIVMSLGSNHKTSKAIDAAVEIAISLGVLIFAAAGNDGKYDNVDAPANHPDIIAVGSHDKDLQRSLFSDSGPELDVYGPGERILSTQSKDQYQFMSGTSQATPWVAGMVAKYLIDLSAKYKIVTPYMIRQMVSHPRGLSTSVSKKYGYAGK